MRERFRRAGVAALFLAIVAGPAAAGTLDKIKAERKVTIGYRDSSVPFSYLDDKQRPVGYSIDICKDIVDRIGKTLTIPGIEIAFNPVTSATRIPLVANGTVDLECGSTSNTKERQAVVAFAPTTFVATSNFVSKKDRGFTDYASLKGQAVVSTAGTTDIKLVNQLNADKNLGLTILSAKDHAEAFLMVETGRAAAFVMDDVLIAGLVAASKDPGAYAMSKDYLSVEPYTIMFRRDDPELKAAVHGAMAEMMASGAMKALYAKWFESPIPPRGINLNLPMSDRTRQALTTPTDSAQESAYQ